MDIIDVYIGNTVVTKTYLSCSRQETKEHSNLIQTPLNEELFRIEERNMFRILRISMCELRNSAGALRNV